MERFLLNDLLWWYLSPATHQVGLSMISLILPHVVFRLWYVVFVDEIEYFIELTVLDCTSLHNERVLLLKRLFTAL